VATAGAALALVTGTLGSTWEAIRARRAEREEILLRSEADRARAGESLQRVAAEQHLYDALLGEARARQLTGRAGQRFKSLDAIIKAARLRSTNELSDEAVSAFSLTDVRDARQWTFSSHWMAEGMCFDRKFELYECRKDTPCGISVRRVHDDHETAFLPITDIADIPNGLLPRGFDPGSRYLAAMCWPRTGGWRCRIWDLNRAGALVFDQACRGSPDFTPDGEAIAMLDSDDTITIKEIDSGKELKRFRLEGRPGVLRFNPAGTRLAALERGSQEVRILDTATGQANMTLRSTKQLSFLAWNHDGTRIATGAEDGSIALWEPQSGRQLVRMEGHESPVMALAFSHRGDLLASGSWDTSLRLWDVETGEQMVLYRTEDTDLQFSPDDRVLAHAIAGETAKLLEVAHTSSYHRLAGLSDLPKSWCVDFSPDGRLIATSTSGGIAVWDVVSEKEIGFITAPGCRSARFQTTGGLGLVASTEAGLYRWPLQIRSAGSGECLRIGPPKILLAQEAFRYFALQPGGEKVLASRANGAEPLVIDLDNPTNVMRLHGLPGAESVAWDPSRRWIATGTWKGAGVNVYDAETGQLACSLSVKGSALVAFSPDQKWLATADSAGFRLWQVGSWEPWPICLPGDRVSEIKPMAFSPDGQVLAVVHAINEIQIAKVPSCEVVATLKAPTLGSLSALTFSSDGSRLAVVEWGGKVDLWDLREIRDELKKLNLDWDLAPLPPVHEVHGEEPTVLRLDSDPFGKEELTHLIPPRDTTASTNLVDLSDFYNAPLTESWHSPREARNNLSELNRGVQQLTGIDFDVRGLIQIGTTAANGLAYPNHVLDIPIQRQCRRVHFLHAAIFAARARLGDELGSYVFHYTDGRQAEMPIVAGKDLGEWWSQPNERDKQWNIAWSGNNPSAKLNGHTIRLFKTTWQNPYPEVPINHFDFTSDKPTPGQPFLVAVTVEP
jgi:WD40 repeat protein